MSRSYRKQPVIKCGGDYKIGKRMANKRVRHTPDLANGKSYKKVYCSYDICDCRFLYTNNPNINKFSKELMDEFDSKPRFFWRKKFENIWREKARRK